MQCTAKALTPGCSDYPCRFATCLHLLLVFSVFTKLFLAVNYISLSRLSWRHSSSCSQLIISGMLIKIHHMRSKCEQMIWSVWRGVTTVSSMLRLMFSEMTCNWENWVLWSVAQTLSSLNAFWCHSPTVLYIWTCTFQVNPKSVNQNILQ